MLPWVLIDAAESPDGAPLELWRRGEEYSIRTAGQELMSSRQHGSEAELSRLALAALGDTPRQRALIGGLGCGYTLAAALAALGPRARVTVDEISAAVIEWNRGVLGALAGHPLRDGRATVKQLDIVTHLLEDDEELELILLDVDNGPRALSQARNAWLYGPPGVRRLRERLRPGGVLGVWSAGPDRGFVQRLRAERLEVQEHRVPASGGRGKRHTLWIARRGR